MPEHKSLEKTIREMTPRIEELLKPYEPLLGPGKEFVVQIIVREIQTVRVETHVGEPETSLSDWDWENVLGSGYWNEKYRKALELVRNNGNQPISVEEVIKPAIPGFHAGDRDYINTILRRRKLPYFLRNTGYGIRNSTFQLVRR